MNAKVFLLLTIAIILTVIMGFVFLLQKQIQSKNGVETGEGTLSLSGEEAQELPPKSLDGPTETITNSDIENNLDKTLQYSQAPDMTIDTNAQYEAILKTSEGDITILFTTQETPITVNNFVTLANDGFYDNTIFHRVIEGFMIQGGDPKGNGTGGPGYQFDDEPFSGSYTRGTVAMANAGKNTNGSQFFIMHEDSQSLPKDYVIFGQVTQGMEVVDAIATAKVKPGPSGELSTPITPSKINSITITKK